MEEHPLLQLLARLCGDVLQAEGTDAAQILSLQQTLAAAIINDSAKPVADNFQPDNLPDFSRSGLSAAQVTELSATLQRLKESPQAIDPTIRVFRREVPFHSSQLKASVPDWARGAAIDKTLGPFKNKDGRRVWYDIYRVVPLVQLWVQGAARPFALMPLLQSQFGTTRGVKQYDIPKGSVWIHADVFDAGAPDHLYCGLTVSSGAITLDKIEPIGKDFKIVIAAGQAVQIDLQLVQQTPTETSSDNNGIDVKAAALSLPKTLSLTFGAGPTKVVAGDASWNLYGQEAQFTFNAAAPIIWNSLLHRIAIPFTTNINELSADTSKSEVCNLSGKASVTAAGWMLSAAAIDINAPLQAEGIGAMGMAVGSGLRASWMGLKDAALHEQESALLKNALITLMPGRLNIATLEAAAVGGRQRYLLWQEPDVDGVPQQPQTIDLTYTSKFYFFYDSQLKGIETVAVQANGKAALNKPVGVNGYPFALESLQTMLILAISKDLQAVMLYDDNIIQDNWSKTVKPIPGAGLPPAKFGTSAIALNNALLTVSPVAGMVLFGDLQDEERFDKCLLLLTFGLMDYLPTLPDPYAANVSLLRRSGRWRQHQGLKPEYELSQIRALLVCLLHWDFGATPDVRFFAGDKPAAAITNALNDVAGVPAQQDGKVRLDKLTTRETLFAHTMESTHRASVRKVGDWQAAAEDAEASAQLMDREARAMMTVNRAFDGHASSPFFNAFTLLDVSTAADLMGVSLAFSNDDYIFRRTHTVKDEAPGNPISINGLDVYATGRFVQLYMLPQISWEPMISAGEVTNTALDPWPGQLYFLNDGPPTQIANFSNKPVNMAPLPLVDGMTKEYHENDAPLWSYFTLSNGMLAVGLYFDHNGSKPQFEKLEKNFDDKVSTSLQLKTAGFHDAVNNHKKFLGGAHQLSNINNLWFPATDGRSVLSASPTEIFNREFSEETHLTADKYIPLERYDFSGYGANVFSHWLNANAALAQTSQALFDVWRGRTAHEVVQVRSVIYPYGIRVVRTITVYRSSTGIPWRSDSGWKAESDGIFDFRTPVKEPAGASQALKDALADEQSRAYIFHPGMVEGVYNVRNIKEDITLKPFETAWNKDYGVFINNQGHPEEVGGGQALVIKLVPVYFDSDVQLDDVTQGATGGRVPTQRMLGYIQLSPKGVFISAEDFANLLLVTDGVGGPVDCTVNINSSKQLMRISGVKVKPSMAGTQRVFVVSANGTPVLPKDGSWSAVRHTLTTKEVQPLAGNEAIPLVRHGARLFTDITKQDYLQDKGTHPVNIAEPTELFKALEDRIIQFGFVQSTGENKILFRNPLFEKGVNMLKGSVPDLADAYRLLNSKGIFPKLEGLPKITELAGNAVMNIVDEGYQLLNNLNPGQALKQLLPEGPWYIVDTAPVKVYIEYKSKDGAADVPAFLDLDINSQAQSWMNKMNDISMWVDLGSFSKILCIRGKFDTAKGKAPRFIEPIMEFGPQLKPVYDILVLLSQLSINPNYKDILTAGLKIAMSNSPTNWEYKFQADKEIPLLKFPPVGLDTATAPLRLEANLKAGVYFNVAIPLPPTGGIQAPSAGAFVEFYGKLSVMCVSVAAAAVYAVGQATVRIGADTAVGPSLYMKFGFGVEVVVALPVIGAVSVYFAAGVELSLDSSQITVAGFVLFRGHAEIFGGIVSVTIQIEASGKVQDRIGDAESGSTTMIAQVTFSLDISICFIIDISFTEQWQEQRQLA